MRGSRLAGRSVSVEDPDRESATAVHQWKLYGLVADELIEVQEGSY